MLSIIIPAKNEENYLPKLLESIKNQTHQDYEIIVADADSSDNTAKIAKLHKCKVVKGGIPSIGRNNGAKAAKGDILVFLDADIILPKPNTLQKINNRFQQDIIALTTSVRISPEEEKFADKIIHRFINRFIKSVNALGIGASRGACQAVRKQFFTGYNPKLNIAEDVDLFRRLKKKGRIHFANNITVFESPRRYREEGYPKIISTWIINGIWCRLFGRSLTRQKVIR